ncbi:purine-nucleoside phosphorylase [Aerococcaceae bacterium NML210727]|nr:purine-nucleoside phosphorylase [Aerococcaceae bacterium NML210727]MCW6654038.1 purine-nucleoside phosphorylase [Aerococcaceae bacterium NML201296]MCW6663166.1 purine-nucleoside phosphorylase [Aerococcaceae bacterium NML190073]MCW6664952.1 purine-nucleoside phosphorylase [Aerococcaceae bacterium NML191219]MCW6667332.1 purine-nucleoside phosphorylase [Aerococcaceae bacterium NML190938]MCW6680826.1 purine-nucleoside phosphorylase [Aerococcaceae bacterium NML130460]MCW6682154.1 purine-nucleos
MSIHISATKGQIAETVLFPGDPLRAKFIAETFLEDVEQYNTVRNMFGYTGTYKGVRVSVQGSGMGIPSAMIYAEELYQEYGVKTIIRIGTAGGMKEEVRVRDIVFGQGATTDSSALNNIFQGQVTYAALASFNVLDIAYHIAQEHAPANIHVGNILSSDRFYNEEMDKAKLARYGVLAVEMEAAGLYAVAAKHNRQALAMCTISDHLITGEETTSQEREQTFTQMMTIALETAVQLAK